MKTMRRILSLTLSALLLAGVLSGCTDSQDPEATPTEGQETVSPTPAAGESVPMVETPDMVQQLLGFPRDTTLLTVDGRPVAAEDFLYCLTYATESLGYSLYGGMADMDWTAEVEDTPIKTYLIDSAVESAQFYAVVESKAAEYGITISEEEQAQLDSELASVVEQLGGTEAYAARLQALAISDEGFRRLNRVSPLYNDMQEMLFGENGEHAPTDEELCEFAESQADALMAKHILIRTVDDSGEPLPEEEQAAARATAEDLLAQIRAADDPIATFDQLMNEYSEDGRDADGNLAYPDGYLFTAGQMAEEFETATRALEYNEISDLVESEVGYHIILRLPPVNDEVRSAWTIVQMNDQVNQWMEESQLETTEEFSTVDPETYYNALSALREELDAEAGASATPAPESDTQE